MRAESPGSTCPAASPPWRALDTHRCCCSGTIYTLITTIALHGPLVAPVQHRRAPWPRSTWRTVPSAGSPPQPPHFRNADVVTPTRSPSAASGTARGGQAMLRNSTTPAREQQRGRAGSSTQEQTGPGARQPPALPRAAPDPPQCPTKPTRGAEGGEPRPRARWRGQVGTAALTGRRRERRRRSLQQRRCRPCPPNQILIQTSPPEL